MTAQKIKSRIAEESPKLWNTLLQNYSDKRDLVLLDRAFQLAQELAASIEPGFTRQEGVSFNPRPARIAQIFLENITGRPAAEELILCFFLPCEFEGNNLHPEVNEKHSQSFERSRQLQKAQEEAQLEQLEDLEILALASYSLDLLRHLHLSDYPLPRKESIVNSARLLTRELHTRHISSSLQSLLEATISRTERYAFRQGATL